MECMLSQLTEMKKQIFLCSEGQGHDGCDGITMLFVCFRESKIFFFFLRTSDLISPILQRNKYFCTVANQILHHEHPKAPCYTSDYNEHLDLERVYCWLHDQQWFLFVGGHARKQAEEVIKIILTQGTAMPKQAHSHASSQTSTPKVLHKNGVNTGKKVGILLSIFFFFSIPTKYMKIIKRHI